MIRWAARKRYLLRDQFPDVLAAGAVNGTVAVLGPGTRTVADTQSHLSLANGVVTIDGGRASPAWGDPCVRYPVLTRAWGRVLLATVTPANATTRFGVVFAVSATYAVGLIGYDGVWRVADEALFAVITGAPTTGFTYAGATTYQVAVVLRTLGCWVFVKGGAFTTWQLLWVGVGGAQATLTALVVSYNAALTVDDVRVPQRRWLPRVLVSDGFGTAGALASTDGLGHTEAHGGGGRTWTGATWTAGSGVATNTPVATPADVGELFATVDAGVTDVMADVTVTVDAAKPAGLVLNLDSAAAPLNYVAAYLSENRTANLDKCVGGVTTSLINTAVTYAAAKVLRVVKSGTSYALFYKGAQVGTTQTIEDAAILAGTRHGILAAYAGASLDNFVLWPTGSNGEYAGLDGLG